MFVFNLLLQIHHNSNLKERQPPLISPYCFGNCIFISSVPLGHFWQKHSNKSKEFSSSHLYCFHFPPCCHPLCSNIKYNYFADCRVQLASSYCMVHSMDMQLQKIKVVRLKELLSVHFLTIQRASKIQGSYQFQLLIFSFACGWATYIHSCQKWLCWWHWVKFWAEGEGWVGHIHPTRASHICLGQCASSFQVHFGWSKRQYFFGYLHFPCLQWLWRKKDWSSPLISTSTHSGSSFFSQLPTSQFRETARYAQRIWCHVISLQQAHN